MSKKLVFNKETKIIEVIEENPKSKKETITFIISILSFIISVGALGVSYSQKNINEKQADINDRRFNLEKKPTFECYIEQEELYNDEEYWDNYREWLYKNEIQSFDEWYQQKFPKKTVPYISEKRKFWDSYDNYNDEILAELTEGEFEVYENEYRQYLLSKNYIKYNRWKEFPYVFEKDYIILKNTGAYITNATLNVYSYISYQLHIGDDISYSFVIDMNRYVLNEFWTGQYIEGGNYDSGNNSFYIKYIQRKQGYEEEYSELNDLLEFLSCNDILNEIGLGEKDISAYYVIDKSVYFSISYLDNEQEKQTDWYKYYKDSNTLSYVEIYDSSVEVPDITKEGFTDAYYEAESLRVAEILGYQNAQWRPFLAFEDFSYIEKAKDKIITDLKKLVNDM